MSNNKKGGIYGKGYYIALILCAAAIGISGYMYYRNANETKDQLQEPVADVAVSNQQEEDVKVKGRNVLVVQVNMNNEILYYYGDEAKRVTVSDVQPADLRKIAKEFIANPENKANMPEFHPADPPLPLLGAYPITKNHIISVQTDRSTKYDVYFQIQNELMAAYNELRDEFAREKFGKYFRDLTEDERLAVTGVYPMKISEAEPKKYGGN